MSIVVLDAAPDRLLASKATLAADLGISEIDAAALIQQASSWIENFTGRVFAYERVCESLPGDSMPNMLLSRTPIASLSSVAFHGTDIDPVNYSLLDAEAGIIQKASGWTSTNLPWNAISPMPSSYSRNLWAVTYYGGYILPNWDMSDGSYDGEQQLPAVLHMACLRLAKTIYIDNNQIVSGGMKTYQIGDTMVQWDSVNPEADMSTLGLPLSIVGVLNYYRRSL